MKKIKTRWSRALVVLAALSMLVMGAPAAEPQDSEDSSSAAMRAARGRTTYRIYCRNCHGKDGVGDGPIAELLKVPPADLTQITQRNGTFPSDELYGVIDGRNDVRGHGSREMPIWGIAFQERNRDTDQEDEVKERIADLVAFLESIQAATEASD